MKLKLSDKHVKGYKVKVTDIEGNSMTFDSVKEAAEGLNVGIQTIYQALHSGKDVRGCKLEKVI